MNRKFINIYYTLKPVIPRRMQIGLRRHLVLKKRRACADCWPIDEMAGKPPEGWAGWPEGKQFALVLTHDVETAQGQENCYPLVEMERKMGFRSSFNFVPKRYDVSPALRRHLTRNGFEVGVHGLYHDGKYWNSRRIFQERAVKINHYLKEWEAAGFRSPSMMRKLDWIHDLEIEYDASTFDTDPFEPQAEGAGTIFPFSVRKRDSAKVYIELPYTLPQDFTLFVLMEERNIDIWKVKSDWLAQKGGMILVIVHPDYMNFGEKPLHIGKYPAHFYKEFLDYIKTRYEGRYWHALPREMARFWSGGSPTLSCHPLLGQG
jgi:hypothetical protein